MPGCFCRQSRLSRKSAHLRHLSCGMLSKAALEWLPSESIPMPNKTWRLRFCLKKLRRRSWTVRALVLFISMRCYKCLRNCSAISYSRCRFACPDPSLPVWCGNLRNSDGKLVLDSNGNAQSVCAASSSSSKCPGTPNWGKAVPQTQSVAPYTATTIKAVQDDNAQIASLDISSDVIQTAGTTFAISPVADSVYQAGVFSKLFAGGRLRSPLISIKPNLIVDTRSSGVTLTMTVDVPSDKCMNATMNMKVRLLVVGGSYCQLMQSCCRVTIFAGLRGCGSP